MGIRKPFRFGGAKNAPSSEGSSFDPSNPWGDVGSNITPQSVHDERFAKSTAKQTADEKAKRDKSSAEQASAKAKLGQRKQTPDDNAPRSYRNDID